MEGDLKAVVVIIKLPSPDNPSEGKVITGAIALKESYTAQNPNPNPTPMSDEDQAEGGNVLPLHSAEVNNSIPESGEARRRIRIRGKKNPSFRLKRVASVCFAALVVYFFWKYAPSTLELEEGELQDSDDDDRSEDENNMFFPIQSKKVFMHSDSEVVFPKDLNSSTTYFLTKFNFFFDSC